MCARAVGELPPEPTDAVTTANNLVEAFWTEALLTARLAMAAPDSREHSAIEAQLTELRRRIDELEDLWG